MFYISSLIKDLAALVDRKRVLGTIEDLLAYANDATHKQVVPAAVVLPESTAEVAAVLRYANERSIPVIPRGAGSSLAGGATPVPGSIVFDLKRMHKIIEIDRNNLTAIVECGVVTQKFQEAVEEVGLFYPPDPQSMSICTLGANVATRAGGPRGVKYGTTKDYVLGIEAVLPDGAVINYGGKSVKMSSGYDLARVFTGSEGTLGVITRVMLKLITLPPYRRTMVAVFSELDPAAEAVSAIIAEGANPSCLEMLSQASVILIENYIPLGLPRDAEAFLLIEIDGHPSKVEEDCKLIGQICKQNGAKEVRLAQTEAEAEKIWLARRALFPAIAHLAPNVLIEDATVPRTQVPAMVRAIGRIAERNKVNIGVSGHVGDGNLHPGIMADKNNPELMERVEKAMGEIAAEALRLSGTLSGEHGIGTLKAHYLEWEHKREGVDLMRRIKKAFDPKGIMNPGKIWPGSGGEDGA